jgi:hypothetical protein
LRARAGDERADENGEEFIDEPRALLLKHIAKQRGDERGSSMNFPMNRR